MKLYSKFFIIQAIIIVCSVQDAKAQKTVFEKTNGIETSTYPEVINFYRMLAHGSDQIKIETGGLTDAGIPLHTVLVNSEKKFSPKQWHDQKKVVIMILNGIHPGEPDGIDACMMLVRDIAAKKIILPKNIALAIIPVYNIGGALNRSAFSRVNQDGPSEYGFRGNAQNLDLNRDFIKSDSKNARSFAEIFHEISPDIFIDNHVSDGADYQHTMTLITGQYNKMGNILGEWVKKVFDPALFKGMKDKNHDMVPYVNAEGSDPASGFTQFYDEPRYSTGFATLFNAISYMPETHMLKPYKLRVMATYDLMKTFIETANYHAQTIIQKRNEAIAFTTSQKNFTLKWEVDSSKFDLIPFKGYEASSLISDVTGKPVLFYDHSKPFTKQIPYYDYYKPVKTVKAPKSYIVPQGWWTVLDLLKLNNVEMRRFTADTSIEVTVTRIESYKSLPFPYEKHHKNNDVTTSETKEVIHFRKGDYLINLDQNGNRYLVETLEPTGDDGFFAWNFFDAVLQQKEGYSEYRWNAVAEDFLKNNPDVKKLFEEKKKSDTAFANNPSAQFRFVYRHSPWYEPAHMRYPIFKIME